MKVLVLKLSMLLTVKPNITCTIDTIKQTIISPLCEANVTIPDPINMSDNCGLQTLSNNITGLTNPSGNFPVGYTNVIFTQTDIHGNDSSCTIVIEVDDNILPVIDCGENDTS